LLLIQILNLLECLVYDWSDANEGERYVAFAKAMRSAFRDRFAVYGDSYHVSVPVEELQSKEYAERVAGDEGSSSPHQHDIEAGSTTHFTIVDREGNIACHTQTLGAAWGSGVVIPGTGVLLNNHTNWMDPRPDFGNSIGPNRRPMAGYAPSLFFEKGKPRLAIGSPGSYRIPTAIAQVFLNSHHRGMPLQDAVEAPRIHFDAGPLQMEDDFSGDMAVALSEDGFEISTHPPHEHYFGGVNAVEIHEDGSLSTGADPRRGCLGDVAG
jgi:gamma-glutamyltranspeptidase/glutathione hydrolase